MIIIPHIKKYMSKLILQKSMTYLTLQIHLMEFPCMLTSIAKDDEGRKRLTALSAISPFHIVGSYGQNQLVVGSELSNMNSANEFQVAIDF